MRKGLVRMKQVCRENRYTIRDYEYDSKAVSQAQAVKQLHAKEQHKALIYLIQWCKTNFSELFQLWIHLKAIRTLVESVLRFGLPVNMCPSIIQVSVVVLLNCYYQINYINIYIYICFLLSILYIYRLHDLKIKIKSERFWAICIKN